MRYTNLYYTDNHEYAAFLMASRRTLDSFYRSRGNCVFVFEDGPECERIIQSIIKGDHFIEATSLVEALKTINGIMNIDV